MTDGPYRWHECPSGAPRTMHDALHFSEWERLPARLRQALVNAIVSEDHEVELAGWPSPRAERKTGPREAALAEIAAHLKQTDPPWWLNSLAMSIAEGVRDRCGFCMALPRAVAQPALPGIWKAAEAPRKAAPPPPPTSPATPSTASPPLPAGVLSTDATVALLRSRLTLLRGKAPGAR